MSEHSSPISSTWTGRLSGHPHPPNTRFAMANNHERNLRQVCSTRITPIHRLAGRRHHCHRAWRLSRRHNPEHPTGTPRTATVTGHHRKCRSRQVDPHHGRRPMSNREAVAMGNIRLTRTRMRHRQCGNVCDLARLPVSGYHAGFCI